MLGPNTTLFLGSKQSKVKAAQVTDLDPALVTGHHRIFIYIKIKGQLVQLTSNEHCKFSCWIEAIAIYILPFLKLHTFPQTFSLISPCSAMNQQPTETGQSS